MNAGKRNIIVRRNFLKFFLFFYFNRGGEASRRPLTVIGEIQKIKNLKPPNSQTLFKLQSCS